MKEFLGLGGLFADCKLVQYFLDRKWLHYEEILPALDIKPRPGFLEVLDEFRRCGLPVVIGTAVESSRARFLLERSGLCALFNRKDIVFGCDVQRQKPAPDCFLETARRMGIQSCQQLVFEDSPRGVQSGVAAGSVVIGMPVYPKAVLRLKQAGVFRIYLEWKDIIVPELLDFLSG